MVIDVKKVGGKTDETLKTIKKIEDRCVILVRPFREFHSF